MKTHPKFQLHPEVKSFLKRGTLGGFVGGKEVFASNGETFDTSDPGTGAKLATIASLQPDDVSRAVDAAAQAFEKNGWSRLPVNERCAVVHRLADAVEKRKAVFAQLESLDCGKIYLQAVSDVENFITTLRYYAELAQHLQRRTVIAVPGHEAAVVRHAWGPCGFIIPWNFPFLLCGWGIGPALVAGNTCVVKPAEDTPLSTLFLAHVAKEVGLPDGVLNVVPGLGEVTGAALAHNPRLRRMSFTGSPEVGRLVAESCGGKGEGDGEVGDVGTRGIGEARGDGGDACGVAVGGGGWLGGGVTGGLAGTEDEDVGSGGVGDTGDIGEAGGGGWLAIGGWPRDGVEGDAVEGAGGHEDEGGRDVARGGWRDGC